MGISQMCTGAGDYFRTSKPHSEKLCGIYIYNNNEIRFRFRLLFRGLINRHRFEMKVRESFICAAKVKIELHITTRLRNNRRKCACYHLNGM